MDSNPRSPSLDTHPLTALTPSPGNRRSTDQPRNTMDGIAIDGHGRVKQRDGMPIDGLYAAGGTTGGLEGGGALGYVGGLIKACVFGLRVAEDAARRQ